MGAVCSGGTGKHTTESSGAKSTGFSGKLKSKPSFTKSREVSHPNHKSSDYRKSPSKFDSGELLSFSRELKPSKPSTPSRKGLSKVRFAYVNLGFLCDRHSLLMISKKSRIELRKIAMDVYH